LDFLKKILGMGSSEQKGTPAPIKDERLESHVQASGEKSLAAGRDIYSITVHPEVKAESIPSRLHQLPADLPDFTGREKEIDELVAVLRGGEGQAAISALGGLGGVGKTALAVHVAHKLAPDYPEAQIVVDLMGTADSPLSPAAAMENVVKAFHPEAHLPEDPGDIKDLYRSVLAGKRAFLLLDNAADVAQVRSLLPPAPCGVMVTSRRNIVLPGVQPLNLDVLPEAQAVELLETILGPGRASSEELQDVAGRCGYLPLALRAAGSLLAGHPDWPVAKYVKDLAHEKERLGQLKHEDIEVEATLGLSAAQLVRDKRELAARWQMLTVFPASFDRAAAAAVWEVEEGKALKDLSELFTRSLILYDADKARYRLHDLMRLVAENAFEYGEAEPDREAEQERLAQAALRHAAHYARVLAGVDDLYLEGGEAIQVGLDLFDAEWDNIRAGQAWAMAHSGEREEAARLCSDFPDAGPHILDLRLHPRERIAWLTAALAAARRLKDRAAEGRHLGNLGLAYADLGEPRRAIEYFEKALAILREIGDRRGEGSILGNLGNAYGDLGEPRRAIEFYEQRLVIAREIGDRRGEGNALGNLGTAYADLGEIQRAIDCYKQQLEITREIGDRQGEGTALFNMALDLRELGDTATAIKNAEAALAIFEEIESPHAPMVRQALEEWRREG